MDDNEKLARELAGKALREAERALAFYAGEVELDFNPGEVAWNPTENAKDALVAVRAALAYLDGKPTGAELEHLQHVARVRPAVQPTNRAGVLHCQ